MHSGGHKIHQDRKQGGAAEITLLRDRGARNARLQVKHHLRTHTQVHWQVKHLHMGMHLVAANLAQAWQSVGGERVQTKPIRKKMSAKRWMQYNTIKLEMLKTLKKKKLGKI